MNDHCCCHHHHEPPFLLYGIPVSEFKKVKDAADARDQSLAGYVAAHRDMEEALQMLNLERWKERKP